MASTDLRPTVGSVVLIIDAGCDNGCQLARQLLARGCRVAATARYATALTRISLGQSADQVMTVAADIGDAAQRDRLLQRVQSRFGRITCVLDGRSGEPVAA